MEGDGLASLAVKMEEEATEYRLPGSRKGLEMDSPRTSRRNAALLPPVRATSASDFQNKRLDVYV